MAIMTTNTVGVIAGVDTHADTHHAVVIDTAGRRLGDAQFPASLSGYQALLAFVFTFGQVVRVGVEGTGSYGAGLSRHLRAADLEVVEVVRPNRQLRRFQGKSDPIDAYAAAATALSDPEAPTPKTADGPVEALRFLLTARRSAMKARVAAQVQIKSLLITAPNSIRARYQGLTDTALIRALAAWPADDGDVVAVTTRTVLRSLAHRHQHLSSEIEELDTALTPLVRTTAPELLAAKGLGPVTAAQLLITAGDNPDRLRSDAAFAAPCGAAPIPASSGKTTRHRLNQGGDRHADAALHRVALVRMSSDPRPRDYVARKRAQGHTPKEILRCLKRAIAREVFHHLTNPAAIPKTDDLTALRRSRRITIHGRVRRVTLNTVSRHFDIWPARISEIERGTRRDDTFTERYRTWLLTLDNQ
jgi:transposase